MLNILESDKVNLFKLFLAVMGVFLIGYVGLYYCGWIVITELIDYAECDWECIGKKDFFELGDDDVTVRAIVRHEVTCRVTGARLQCIRDPTQPPSSLIRFLRALTYGTLAAVTIGELKRIGR